LENPQETDGYRLSSLGNALAALASKMEPQAAGEIDRATPWEEIWQAMERLVQDGKVIYAGSSNFAGWHIVKANEAALCAVPLLSAVWLHCGPLLFIWLRQTELDLVAL
jgi:aryl-alcohol dehydrogenase-like predicted oxidoreductase